MIGAPWVRLEIEPGGEGRSIRIRPSALHVGDRRPLSREDIERLLSAMRGGRDHLDL